MWKRILLTLSVLIMTGALALANTQVPAKDVTVNPAGFTGNLGSTDTTVQHALATVDAIRNVSGNAATATALASTPTSCNAGNFPRGIDAAGNAQNCFNVQGALDAKASLTGATFSGEITATNLSGTNTGNQDLSGLVTKTTTVNGHALSANVTVTKTDLSIANVDNTSDANKPVSTAQQTALDLKENLTNKSTGTSLGTSDTLYPSQNAVKTYVDTGLSGKQASLGFTAENVANKSTGTTLGTSDTLYPSQKAVKTYVDNALSGSGGWTTSSTNIYPTSATNVGVGTTSPTQALEVNGTVKATHFVGEGSGITGITPSQWTTSGSNVYYNSGSVGVGTTSPGYKLEVDGQIYGDIVAIGPYIDARAKPYNVKCDGVTDDAAGINAAITAGKVAILPAGTCIIGSAVNVVGDFSNSKLLKGQGPKATTLKYTGVAPGNAVVIGTNGRVESLQVLRDSSVAWDLVHPVNGIMVNGSYSSGDDINIYNFEKGLSFYSDSDANAAGYGRFNIRTIINCFYGVMFDSITDGWTNENTIYAQVIAVNALKDATGTWGIFLDSHSSNPVNSNKFFGAIESTNFGVHITGFSNAFYDVRTELKNTLPNPVSYEFQDQAIGLAYGNYIFGMYYDTDLYGTTLFGTDPSVDRVVHKTAAGAYTMVDTNIIFGNIAQLPTVNSLHLTMNNPGSYASPQFYSWTNDNYAGGIYQYKRGNNSSQDGAVANNGEFGSINALGWDGSAYGKGTVIYPSATQAWTTSHHGAALQFLTTPNNSTTNGVVMTLDQSGNVGIGNLVPPALLTVGASPTIPTGSAPAVAIKNNLVVDGAIYGNGANLTGLPASTSGANPTGTIGLTAVNGSASTYLRSDGAPALGVAISPTWTGNHTFAPSSGNTLFSSGNVGIGTATPRSALDVSGDIYGSTVNLTGGTGVMIGTTSMSGTTLLTVGTGAATAGPTLQASSSLFKTDIQVDGVIYNPGIAVTSGNYVCFDTTSKKMYVKSTCP